MSLSVAPTSAGPKPLPDGTLGYIVDPLRTDDCLRPCIATVLQIPADEVPDPQLDARLAAGEQAEDIDRSAWQELQRWLASRGLRMVLHERVPVARKRWVGVCANTMLGRPRHWADHSIVMSHGRLLHDPVDCLDHLLGCQSNRLAFRAWRAEHVTYGISFVNQPKGAKT